ncbi:AAA family ATPase [Rhizobium rhizogenes]|uniref:ATP-dependent hydrolase n=1 Tax=Rhizobium rhizogenes TaxID=359 RepID=A0AA92C4M6_RHIRH|nr:AAA family ATPase [Rhizobium rhizogenes]PVE55372.1 ATP-dependent hydrolase [Rhizobium rhizogenes]PVE65706.1 ATP-dependent hydrolase [Agrobacterium tumefaciens]PVE75770.1 ATP-dependent hydrolase [Sphingomonas sp. TPD3009]
MTNRPQARRRVTLERLTYALTLKSAARLGGAFKKNAAGRQFVIVLRIPLGTDIDEYVAGASILTAEAIGLAGYEIASPKLGSRGGVDIELIRSQLKSGHSMLVIWPLEYELPREINLAADRVVDVGVLRPFQLVAAAKGFSGQIVDMADARKILEHPLSEVFAAFRAGRPASDVLARLAEVKTDTQPPVVEAPSLESLVGYGEAKTWGLSLARDIAAWKAGNLAWADVDRGLLLSGAPGTGKTMFAGALARSCEARLVATSVAGWQAAGHLDDTLKAMRKCFDEAKAQKPSILFVDEFDGIGDRDRIAGTEYENYWTQVINFLLELIDGHEKLEGVVVIGATNHPEAIDAALLRPGRLDRHIRVSLPDGEERKHLSRTYFGDQLSDREVDAIAAATVGLTGAHFQTVGRDAKRLARAGGRAVSFADVMSALPPARKITGGERRTIAIHEAGHAVVGVRLGVGLLDTVAVPWQAHAGQPLGFAHFEIEEDQIRERQGCLDHVALLLAGRAAEEVILGTAFDGAGDDEGCDLHKASDLATRMEVQLGMGEGLGYFNLKSVEQRDRFRRNNREVAARIERVLGREMERSRDIVTSFRSAIEKIAEVLVEKAIIDGEEVRTIVRETSR